MNHRLATAVVSLAALMLAFVQQAHATEVPHYVNFQTVLRDDSGNIVEDGFIDIQMKILNQANSVVYEETQPGVQVVRGAINILIGEGIEPGSSPAKPTNGLPIGAVDPAKGSHFLQIQFGSNQPSDPMELGSVPYAMYAEQALSLPKNFPASSVPDSFATDDELAAAVAAHEEKDIATAHPNGKLPADRISGQIVTTQISDGAVTSQQIKDGTITTTDMSSPNISQWNNNSGYLTPSTADSNYVKKIGDTMTGALNVPTPAIKLPNPVNVGDTLDNHETRLQALEGAPTPPAAIAKAWVKFHTDGSHGVTLDSAFNVSNVTYTGTDDGGWAVTFSTPFLDTNYVMAGSAGADSGGAMMISCNAATSSSSTAHVIGTDKNGNSQTGNARVYNLVFFGN